jgi:very-short-patch-repair endonuclease
MSGNRDSDARLKGFARQMRSKATDAEKKLWSILRDRRLSGFKFRRQVPVAGYILDFYCIKAGLVVEADGGQHSLPEQLEYDHIRTSALESLGIQVLRFWDCDVLKDPDAVKRTIYRALTERPSPQPSPGVPGEGEISRDVPGNGG